ncbi:hypothetical protein GH714_027093 [Hevea brasiliensis]|uniref:Myb-like domain-containing protein n=1 Tax=Hevea brasiliensis TaxID=3981 RepID=A0A6A6LRP2_HEVBR|nr:hypothetical protein GH714_027093 [Hevea brasiliensis]
MGRRPCCAKDAGLNRGAWTAHEDKLLADYIQVHGDGKWRDLPQKAVPSLASRENNDDPKNLLMNFEMGDGDHQLFMLEPADAHAFANFEFSYDLNYGNKNNNGDDFSPSSPMLFSEEMLQDLTTTTDYVQPQGFSCLSPFTSFLDSGRVWLGD